MELLTTTLLHVVIDVKWGIASPADPSILQVRWILSNSIMIDIIKIREARHGIRGFLSVSIDCFSVSLWAWACVSQGCGNGAVSGEKKGSIANNFHV